MTERKTLLDDRPRKGEKIRLVQRVQVETRFGLIYFEVGTPGTITSAGDCYVFAKVGGRETELFQGEFERV